MSTIEKAIKFNQWSQTLTSDQQAQIRVWIGRIVAKTELNTLDACALLAELFLFVA